MTQSLYNGEDDRPALAKQVMVELYKPRHPVWQYVRLWDYHLNESRYTGKRSMDRRKAKEAT